MLTSPAAWLLLVSLSMLTLLRLRSPELLMETWPDWLWIFSTTFVLSPSKNFKLTFTCLLVIMDKSLSKRSPCGWLFIVTLPDLE